MLKTIAHFLLPFGSFNCPLCPSLMTALIVACLSTPFWEFQFIAFIADKQRKESAFYSLLGVSELAGKIADFMPKFTKLSTPFWEFQAPL